MGLVGQELLGRFRVQHLLGQGGSADVYKLWDPERRAFFAMKALVPELARDGEFVDRFTREAEPLTGLLHPHIVRYHGLETDGEVAFLLMDLVEGQTLRHEIAEAKDVGLSLARTAELLRPICSALDYAHRQGFTHGDLKPSNILIDTQGAVWLTDFGLAPLIDAASPDFPGTGTPAYMAPEQEKGGQIEPATDIYALGVILYELLSGGQRPPKAGSNPPQIVLSTLRAAKARHVGEFEALISRCLAPAPEARFESAGALLAAFEAIDAGEVRPRAAAPLKRTARPRDLRRGLGLAISALLMILIVIAGWVAFAMWNGELGRSAVGRALQDWTGLPTSAPVVVVTELVPAPTTPPPTAEPSPSPAPEQASGLPADLLALAREGIVHNADWTPSFATLDGYDLALVPAGCLVLGGDRDLTCFSAPFWVDRYEATLRQMGLGPSDLPAGSIRWAEANDACDQRGGRLPTAGEWEYVARGPDGLAYPWGNDWDAARVVFRQARAPLPVGERDDASWVGAFDLVGNIAEWTTTVYPNEGFRLVKGGSWFDTDLDELTPTGADSDPEERIDPDKGFRCVFEFEAIQP